MSGVLSILLADNAAAAGGSAMSLVLTAASSQYLSRTWGANPTDNKKATISLWCKRASLGTFLPTLYDGGDYDSSGASISVQRFEFSDAITQIIYNGAVVEQFTSSPETVADTTTWHHLLFKYDTTDATGNNRVRIYLDGVEVGYGTQTPITQNATNGLTVNGKESNIGREVSTADRFYDGKLAYVYFIDGQALTPSSFITGTPGSPKTFSGGSYGTNGFLLDFSGSSTNDHSGSTSNNWTQQGSPTFSSDVPT